VTDGWLLIIHVGNAGMCHHDSIEVDELHHPILVRHRGLVSDSEGAGRFRGAPGIRVEFGPTEGCEMDVLYTADGTVSPALGARGGQPGGLLATSKRTASGELETLAPCGGVRLVPGETVVSIAAGGGGYGSPLERDPDRVKRDMTKAGLRWRGPRRLRCGVQRGGRRRQGGNPCLEKTIGIERRVSAGFNRLTHRAFPAMTRLGPVG
jgi:N-methylhydantoinase B